jgi:hypothetical protein
MPAPPTAAVDTCGSHIIRHGQRDCLRAARRRRAARARPGPTPTALDAAAGSIAGACNVAAAPFGAKAGPERIGFFAGMPKLHKPRLGWRFLTCSFEVCPTPLAKLLDTFLRALLPVCGQAWARAMQGVPSLPAESLPPWNQTSSADCIPTFRLSNSGLVRWSTYEARGGMHTGDFERLYTNIPLADLKAVLAETVALCFDERGATAGFLEFTRLRMHNTHPGGARGGTRYNGQWIWSAAQATAALHLLLDNTYVLWGGYIFRQVQGIPMGTNPAVFIASLYLFMYELRFMSRLAADTRRLPAGADTSERYTATRAQRYFTDPVGNATSKPWAALHILRVCGSNQRFVDDLFTIANPYLDCLAYDTQIFCGFQGCYLACLNLAAARGACETARSSTSTCAPARCPCRCRRCGRACGAAAGSCSRSLAAMCVVRTSGARRSPRWVHSHSVVGKQAASALRGRHRYCGPWGGDSTSWCRAHDAPACVTAAPWNR